MGATSAMYDGPWRALPDAIFLDWPALSGDITFAAVADHFIAQHNIGPGDSLIGTSLGGIVALEIARRSLCNTVTLISSAVSPKEINSILLGLAPLSSVTPLRFMQHFSSSCGEMGRMFAEVDARFVRSACLELSIWPGLSDGHGLRIHRVHGRHDRIIACPAEPDLELPGGHLIAMTQAEACAEFVGRH